MMTGYASARAVSRSSAELYRPPRRVLPSDAVSKYLRNEKGPFDIEAAPMMREPLDMLGSRRYTGVVFVGPARSSKTFSLIHGAMAYIVTSAPGDTLIVQMSRETARDFSRSETDRVIRHSPELASRLSPRARDDNTFDKFFRSGMVLKFGWPAVSQLSSKTLQYVLLTDYDRPENRDDVDGEGPMWDLAAKRVETYMSRGKCVAESSPGEELADAAWKPATPHEGPPVPGIMELYNRGTRARWFWPCVHCGLYFEARPGVASFGLPPFEEIEKLVQRADIVSLAESFAHVACPQCGGVHEMRHRKQMSARGTWVHEGETVEDGGRIVGERRRSNIASYWLGGVAATFQRWDALLLKYFQAVLSYVRSGEEQPIKATVLMDQADVYRPRALAKRRAPEDLMARIESWDEGCVPDGVRFLTAAVDVQRARFVVQVEGWGLDRQCWIVDRFDVSMSRRTEDRDGNRFAAVDPAAYIEDWDLLVDEVIRKTYPLASAPAKRMRVRLTLCDSGGSEGVTNNAYAFWRKCRAMGLAHPAGAMASRFVLVKGDGRLEIPRVQQTMPDNRGRNNRTASARGDVPVQLLNSNVLKDAISADLGRTSPGPGFVHFADWLPHTFYTELTAEVRGRRGWERKSGTRNESLDLHVYNGAGFILLGGEKIDATRPPAWIDEQLFSTEAGAVEAAGAARVRTLADLARSLNG